MRRGAIFNPEIRLGKLQIPWDKVQDLFIQNVQENPHHSPEQYDENNHENDHDDYYDDDHRLAEPTVAELTRSEKDLGADVEVETRAT